MSILKQLPATSVPRVSLELCRACRECGARTACDTKAVVRVDPDEPPWIDASRCYGCRACILTCPFGAVSLPSQPRPATES